MAGFVLKELPEDDAKDRRDGIKEATRRFYFKTPHPGPPITNSRACLTLVTNTDPTLKPYARHPFDQNLLVTEPSATRITRYWWKISVPYTSEFSVEDEKQRDYENPLEEPADITWSTSSETTIATRDRNGGALTNTAGDPFADIEIELTRLDITIEKNVAKVPPWILRYHNAVNKSSTRIGGLTFPKETLKVTQIRIGKKDKKNGIYFYPLTLEIRFQEETWKERRLNTGRRERLHISPRLPDTKLVQIADKDGQPIDDPVFLDALGRAYRVDVDNEEERLLEEDVKGKAIRNDLEDEELLIKEFELLKDLDFGVLPLK